MRICEVGATEPQRQKAPKTKKTQKKGQKRTITTPPIPMGKIGNASKLIPITYVLQNEKPLTKLKLPQLVRPKNNKNQQKKKDPTTQKGLKYECELE